MQNKLISLFLAIIMASLLGACAFPGVYKINVQQGNIVTQEMLDKLKPGMTKRQVHFVLGKPVVENVFSNAYESYLYTYQPANEETRQQTVLIYYENELFTRYQPDGEIFEEHPAY